MTLLGKRIGKIRIIDQLGEGGMGEVYVGLDETLEREVAVKAIRGEKRLDEEAKARFIGEAKILSQLEHPSICRVYDFVEGEHADFLIMELIRGADLTKRRDKLSDSEKLGIVKQVAEAFSVAHERNIVHRDLKPDNVMLTKEGRVKVLDFGIARSIVADDSPNSVSREKSEIPDSDETVDLDMGGGKTVKATVPTQLASGGYRTKHGEIMGTPMFMSPEQARGEPTSGASDMYSLGLLMQWLFTGKNPYPSKISSTGLLIKAMKGDTQRVEGIDADLTLLINRLKSVNPENRPTALDTRDRIRWIRDKPKRRIKKLAGLAFAILLILGTTFSTIGFYSATQQKRLAESERQRAVENEARAMEEAENAKQTADLLEEFLTSADPEEKGKDLTVQALLAAFRPRLDELGEKPLIQARLFHTYAQTYDGLGLYEESIVCYRKALALREEGLGNQHPHTLNTLNNLANTLNEFGKYDEAEQLSRKCLASRFAVLGEDNPKTLKTLNNLAYLLMNRGKYQDAEKLFRQCVAIKKRVLGDDDPSTIGSVSNLGWAMNSLGDYDQAEQLFRDCLDARKRVLGEEHPRTLGSMNNLAVVLQFQKKYEQTEEILRSSVDISKRVLGEEHPTTLIFLNNLANISNIQGKHQQAEPIARQCLEIRKRVLGNEHPGTLTSMLVLGEVLYKLGKFDESIAVLRQCFEVRKRVLGDDHPDTWSALEGMAMSLAAQGQEMAKAEKLARECVEGMTAVLGAEHPLTAEHINSLATILEKRGKLNEAIELYTKAAKGGNEKSQEALKRLGQSL